MIACLLVYLVGYFVTARRLYVIFDAEQKQETTDAGNMLWAAFCALMWPPALIVMGFAATVFRETPRQRAEKHAAARVAEEKEYARLGLPTPYVDDLDPPLPVIEVSSEECFPCAKARSIVAALPPPASWPTTGALMHRYSEEYDTAWCPTHGHVDRLRDRHGTRRGSR
jgi:hypothetical protein